MGVKHCPVCNGEWYSLARSGAVCNRHKDWRVSICVECGKSCYTLAAGICQLCWNRKYIHDDDWLAYGAASVVRDMDSESGR